MSSKDLVIIALVSIVAISFFVSYDVINQYNELVENYNELGETHNDLVDEYKELNSQQFEFKNNVLRASEEKNTAITVVYFTNFSQNQQIINLSIPYDKYNSTHFGFHPLWRFDYYIYTKNYITENEPIINEIVDKIKNQTKTQEELANALLNFVQDKGNGLNIRYYPTNELKYPLETLVEMGGDCDTHSFLYATLMKAAGFKVLILFSNEKVEGQYHVATAIHLATAPQNSLSDYEDRSFIYAGQVYYYAETTNAWWRVGDIPSSFEKLTFTLLPV